MSGLIPPDLKRCQAEWNEYRPFIMGGNVNQTVRCEKKPVVVAIETIPQSDGLCGSMSLCDEHRMVLIAQRGNQGFSFEQIKQ